MLGTWPLPGICSSLPTTIPITEQGTALRWLEDMASASLSGCLVAYLLYFASFCHVGTAARRHQRETSSNNAPVATVKNGSYEGVYSAGYDQDFFLGMPYATVSSVTLSGSWILNDCFFFFCSCLKFFHVATGALHRFPAPRRGLVRHP